MAQSRVMVLYNNPMLPADHPDAESEHVIVAVAETMAGILRRGGYRPSLLGLKRDLGVLTQELRRQKPTVVLNLFEGHYDDTETESYVAGVMQWFGIPFTGSELRALSLGRAKHFTKQLLRGAGLPTADFFVVEELPVPECLLQWPVIVKPANQDASLGLDQDSVVTDAYQLHQRVAYILETFGPPVLVEEFIDGREINVALMELPELVALPPGEVLFADREPGTWPILTYDGKWKPGTPEYDLTPPRYPAQISSRLADRLVDLAKKAYRLVGCRDYGRVDFRVKPPGKPYILEVNPNPDISNNAGFAGCLGSAGISLSDFVLQLIQHAIQRGKATQPEWMLPRPELAGQAV